MARLMLIEVPGVPGFVPGGGGHPVHLRRFDVADTTSGNKVGRVEEETPGRFLVEAVDATGADIAWSSREGSPETAREALERHLFG